MTEYPGWIRMARGGGHGAGPMVLALFRNGARAQPTIRVSAAAEAWLREVSGWPRNHPLKVSILILREPSGSHRAFALGVDEEKGQPLSSTTRVASARWLADQLKSWPDKGERVLLSLEPDVDQRLLLGEFPPDLR